MITAIVMINCQVDLIPEAAQQIAEVEGVSEVYSVTGDIDLIAVLHLPRYEDLAEVVTDRIAKVRGMSSMKTHLAFRTYSREVLAEAFSLGLD